MIKILVESNPEIQNPTKKMVCTCGCVFTFQKSDVHSSIRNEQYITCPGKGCGKYLDPDKGVDYYGEPDTKTIEAYLTK